MDKAGPGEVVAVSLDGSALIVSDFDGRIDETGCEGMAEPILLRAPFDGGRREPVGVDPEGKPLSGSGGARPRRAGRHRRRLRGVPGPILARPRELPTAHSATSPSSTIRSPGEAFITGWSASGNELLAIAWVQDGEPRRAAVRVDVTPARCRRSSGARSMTSASCGRGRSSSPRTAE